MTPTNKLRFVRRAVPDRTFGDGIARYERILQQWWSIGIPAIAANPYLEGEGEWRDIPVESDE